MKTAAIGLVLLLGSPTLAEAQFARAGPEMEISASGQFPVVAMDAAGNFVVAWITTTTLVARRFDAHGDPLGAPFIVDPAAGGTGTSPVAPGDIVSRYLAMSARGDFAITYWIVDAETRCRHYVIYGPTGEESARGVLACGFGDGASVAADSGGRFVFAWGESSSVTGDNGVYAQVVDAAGVVVVPRLLVSLEQAVAIGPYSLAVDAVGNFALDWYEFQVDPELRPVGRCVSASGALLTGELVLRGALASQATGGFVGVSARYELDGTRAVGARRYDPLGVPLGARQRLSELPVVSYEGRVAGDAVGDVVAAWEAVTSLDDRDIYARRVWASGEPDGAEFRVNTGTAGVQRHPDVASNARGDAVIVWLRQDGQGASQGIFGQRFEFTRPSVTQGDFDGDGRADLLLRDRFGSQTSAWMMAEAVCTDERAIEPATPGYKTDVGAANDFDGDGRNDLLLFDRAEAALEVWLMGGAHGVERVGLASVDAAPSPDPEAAPVATGDFTHDGRADVLWQHNLTHRLELWVLDDARFVGRLAPEPDRPVDPNWTVVGAQDYDLDGVRDLLWFNPVSGRLVQWLLDGALRRKTGRFLNPPQAAEPNWRPVASADYGVGPSGTAGTADVVWRNEASGNLVVWFLDPAGNRTAGTFTTPPAPAAPLEWRVVGPR